MQDHKYQCNRFDLRPAFKYHTAIASSSSEEQSLARGAIEDVTPQQKYRTAIREAGGGYKEWLRECTHMQIAESRSCRLEAKATYDRDMAKAKLILRDR